MARFESFCGLQLWLPALRSVDRTPGVPMLLGAAAFAALESDAYHHTLPACRPVEFTCGSRVMPGELPMRTLRTRCALFRSTSVFAEEASRFAAGSFAIPGPSREVKRISQALQFTIVIKRARFHAMEA